MIAAIYEEFDGPIEIRTVPDPTPDPDGTIIRVAATGVCRSDYHGWRGHDPDITLPHVPGHELAGVIEELGASVRGWRVGQRVTVPFVTGCGRCPQCLAGHQQICDHQEQPGFTGWGSFAELVHVHHAAENLVALPDGVDDVTAASLGCRFTTAWRAVVEQGRTEPGEWLAVHGAGGVGLSAVMIGVALGARVVAVDVQPEALALARDLGATALIDAGAGDVVAALMDATEGGAHVSLDALGSTDTCANSLAGLRKRGRHIQVGILTGAASEHPVPMHHVIARELEVRGSHGMAAHGFPALLAMIERGALEPARLVRRRVDLAGGVDLLTEMDRNVSAGMAVIQMPGAG
jgi:alcohol dehydrogenase